MIDFRRFQNKAKILCMSQHYLLFSRRPGIIWMDDTCTPQTTRTNHEPRWQIYTTLGPYPKHGWQTATPCQLEYPPMMRETEKPASAASAAKNCFLQRLRCKTCKKPAKPAKTCFCRFCRFFAALAGFCRFFGFRDHRRIFKLTGGSRLPPMFWTRSERCVYLSSGFMVCARRVWCTGIIHSSDIWSSAK